MDDPLTLNCYYLESECYYSVTISRRQSVFELVQQLVEVRKSDPEADPDTIIPIAVYKADITTWLGDVWHHTVDNMPTVQRLRLWDCVGEVIGRVADYPGLIHIIVKCTEKPPLTLPSPPPRPEHLQTSAREPSKHGARGFFAKCRSLYSKRKTDGESQNTKPHIASE